MDDTPVLRRRIHFLDEVRGFDLILMVFFHGFYMLGWIYDVAFGRTLFQFFRPVQPLFAGLFIFICGISCYLSHSNARRGLILAGISVGISLFLYLFMRDEMIWFGILHFLAVSILLFAALRPLLSKVPPLAGIAVCAVLFLLTYHMSHELGSWFGIKGLFTLPLPESLVDIPWLYPLGIGRGTGADYFPLLPWFFCFLAGSFVGVWAKAGRFPGWMYKSRAPWLSWIGKHTLIIYVVHQPVIYVVCGGVMWLIRAFGGGRETPVGEPDGAGLTRAGHVSVSGICSWKTGGRCVG